MYVRNTANGRGVIWLFFEYHSHQAIMWEAVGTECAQTLLTYLLSDKEQGQRERQAILVCKSECVCSLFSPFAWVPPTIRVTHSISHSLSLPPSHIPTCTVWWWHHHRWNASFIFYPTYEIYILQSSTADDWMNENWCYGHFCEFFQYKKSHYSNTVDLTMHQRSLHVVQACMCVDVWMEVNLSSFF